MTEIPRGVESELLVREPRGTEYARLLEAERVARADAERQRGEAERARAEAEAATRAKSAFLATMSHELRTPLNAIIGYAELLDMGIFGAVTPGQHAHLERLRASARHLLGLVSDVLDLAKIDAGQLEVRREIAVTGTAVAAALALVQPQATVKGIVVRDHHAGEPGARYLGDEHRVQQILVNLLSNAVKFTPVGGEIAVDTGIVETTDRATLAPSDQLEGAGPWAFVRIDDTGPGISPAFMSRLFEPFVQEEGSYTREHGGTGLGLSISRRLARMMGGELSLTPIDSEQTSADARLGGASFTLWLPVETAGHDAEPAQPARTTQSRRPVDPPPALTPTAFAVVQALGKRLADTAESVAVRYLARLRAAATAGELPDRIAASQLRNHATPFVGLIASQLMTIGELHGRAPELLGDSGRVQRLMAELHGAQRHRLGWTEAQLERDFVMLSEEIDHALRVAVDEPATAGAAPRSEIPTPELAPGDVDPDAPGAALAYAIEVSHHIVERAKRTSVFAFGSVVRAAK